MNDIVNFANEGTQPRWFAVVGNNGVCITTQEFRLIEALRALKCVAIMEFIDEGRARQYVYAAYVSRFFMRNSHLGITPSMPIHLPAEVVWVEEDYETREGNYNLQNQYFPGIPV